jgi:dTDP-glucose 4,6-dehydratase
VASDVSVTSVVDVKRILVTGGAGFIGSNFVHHMRERYPDYHFKVADSLTYAGNVENLPNAGFGTEHYEFWYGDVRNGELMDSLVGDSDVVVHMAAETHVTRSIFDNRLFFETDVLGTQTVANAVAKHRDRVERFIHISTSEVYGTAMGAAMTEDHPLNPMSPYASAKCGADRLVYSYWATYGVPAIIVRPFNNYGRRQHLEKAVPRFITSCLLGEPLTVHGDGSAARDWLYIDDHCEALDAIVHAPLEKVAGQTFNVGSSRDIAILDVARKVVEAMGGSEASIELIGDRPGQVFRHTCDPVRIRDALGWTCRTSFEEGLECTIAWYADNEEWWRPQMWMRHIPIVTAAGTREMH